ncbi:PREDICTED: DNA topoisomerase 2-binding protein 1-like isoform X2 [Camelina sativa]|uniref:DNA topoisomerase 2-binding protein 1-like isoform X2 n=1 Tax=Camelina sativa TaxID=90675 RepID=A0ABM0TN68_CAMSA|nr:PREDICTED: DNA topoisomerase 2-binding protein 1-like isoform X2 [Camelina sativa]
MKTTQLFKGSNVFMSRNLVPPEVFDTLLDAFKLNGAEIVLCCDPSRSGPSDFHVIASPDHEKFKSLTAKGCNLIGPQCALSCAKEGRPLPQGGFTCCLAMEGLKVLASGFLMDEKVKIREMVTSMGGVFLSKSSSDVNFVIVKNVLAAKYKWALNTQKKPVVTLNWLHQCWTEHRVVPQEPYKVPPFSGLTICVTRIPGDERKGMEKVISEYGGSYSGELTRSCTHLIADAAEGDKYKVARKWGHIQIVTRKWFQQSIDRKVCLSEESYPVLSSIPLARGLRDKGIHHNVQEKFPLPTAVSVSVADSYASCAQSRDSDIEASASQNIFSTSMNPSTDVKEPSEGPHTRPQEQDIDGCTARDSESEDNDLYLSDCRIFLLGFEASEMRRLFKLVCRGGGTRYMLLNESMTHIVVGTPSESEKREVRSIAASGVVQVVTPSWLEDCDREKKEIPVHQLYTATHLILPRDSACLTKGSFAGMSSMEQGKNTLGQTMAYDSSSRSINVSNGPATFLGNKEAMQEFGRKDEIHAERKIVSPKQKETLISPVTSKSKEQQSNQYEFNGQNVNERMSSVFKGKTFCFSHSFPEDRRPEIVEWVNQGGGEVVVNDPLINNADFTIESHGGFRSAGTTHISYVSSHWVRSCLEDGCLVAVSSHIVYSPLPCQTPLPGFESFCICSSQQDDKDIKLLSNLCYVLGAKFVKKLTKKVTHLLCNYANGSKYETASKWGIVSVTPDWVYECVRQNQVVSPNNFHPKELTTQDREAGSGASQFHTQFLPMSSRDNVSLLVSHSEEREYIQDFSGKNGKGEVNNRLGEAGREQTFPSKKAKLFKDGQESHVSLLVSHSEEREYIQDFSGKNGKGEVNNRLGEAGREQTFPSKKAKLFKDGQESHVSLLVSHSEEREYIQDFSGKNGKGEVNNRLGEAGREQTFPSKKAKLFKDGQESHVSLLVSHSEEREYIQDFSGKNGKGEVNNRLGEAGREQTFPCKKAKLVKDGQESHVFPVEEPPSNCDRPSKSGEGNVSGNDTASSREVPDVADAIEDLSEQTSKIQHQKSPGRISEKTLFSTSEQYNTGNHSVTGLSRHWINRVHKNDDTGSPPGNVTTGTYGNFSETQTESQVVSYEEDLSGRQMLIDRVRTRNSLT